MSFTAIIEASIEQFTRALNQAQARLDQFAETTGKKLAEIGQTFDSVGKSLSIGLTVPLTALGVAAVKTFGDIQALKMGLEAVMGSASAASAEFEKLKEVAKLPGLGLKEAVQGSVSLQAAGFSADEARKSLMAFGNALATVGKGAKELSLVNLALTQLQNKTSGFGQDLRQLTEQLPQLRGAMEQAFGTSDSEAISKMGFTGAQVVQMLTKEFEKLPKVTAGINNAFENVSDAVTISLARIGEAINKNFDVEGKLGKLADFLTDLTDKFEKLDPETQKFILLLGGVAAAIGPVLVGIGAILQLAPLVGTAFAVITGPIGLTIAAVAAATIAIIKYWDDIVEYFTNGKGHSFWDNISKSAQSIYNSLKSIFDSLSSFLKAIWDRIGKNVVDSFQSSFGIVLNIVTLAINNVTNILSIFASALKGDWKGVLNGFANLFKDAFKGIVSIVAGAIQSLTNQLAGFFNLIGANKIASGLESFASYLDKFTNSTERSAKATTLVAEALPNLGNKANEAKKPIQGLSDAAKKLADEIANLKLELQGTLMSEWGRQLFDINNNYDAIVKKYGGNKDILNLASQARQAELLRTKIEQISEELGKQQKQNVKGVNPSMNFTLPDITLGKLNIKPFAQGLDELKARIEETSKSIEDIFSRGLVDVISNSMSALGEALATGGNILGAIGNSLVSTLGSLAKSIGEQLIAFGTAGIALKFMITNPYLALAAGAALVALGSFATSSVSKTVDQGTKGGYFGYQSQDYSSYRGGLFDSNRTQTVNLQIKGTDLVGALNLNNNRNNRLS